MAKKPGKRNRVRRRSIMLPESMFDEIEKVRIKVGAKSHSEVIRRAYKLWREIVANDGEFETVNPETGERTKRVIIV